MMIANLNCNIQKQIEAQRHSRELHELYWNAIESCCQHVADCIATRQVSVEMQFRQENHNQGELYLIIRKGLKSYLL